MPDSDAQIDALTDLAGVVLAHDSLEDALVAICRVAVGAVSSAESASITTQRAGAPTAMASDEWGLDMFRVADMDTESRWPSYRPRALAAGLRSALSLPATADGRIVGALNVYAHEPHAFDTTAVSIRQVIAGHAGLAAQVSSAFYGHRDLARQLSGAMASRAVIEQAKGMLMLQQGCDADTAFETLARMSQSANVKLRELALRLVDRGRSSGAAGLDPGVSRARR